MESCLQFREEMIHALNSVKLTAAATTTTKTKRCTVNIQESPSAERSVTSVSTNMAEPEVVAAELDRGGLSDKSVCHFCLTPTRGLTVLHPVWPDNLEKEIFEAALNINIILTIKPKTKYCYRCLKICTGVVKLKQVAKNCGLRDDEPRTYKTYQKVFNPSVDRDANEPVDHPYSRAKCIPTDDNVSIGMLREIKLKEGDDQVKQDKVMKPTDLNLTWPNFFQLFIRKCETEAENFNMQVAFLVAQGTIVQTGGTPNGKIFLDSHNSIQKNFSTFIAKKRKRRKKSGMLLQEDHIEEDENQVELQEENSNDPNDDTAQAESGKDTNIKQEIDDHSYQTSVSNSKSSKQELDKKKGVSSGIKPKKPIAKYKCSICSDSFPSLAAANAHMNTHKDQLGEDGLDDNCDDDNDCNDVDMHSEDQHQESGGKNKKNMKEGKDKIKEETNSDNEQETGKHRCPYPPCDKRFKDQSSFLAHVRNHRNRLVPPCRLCLVTLPNRAELQAHMKIIHKTNITYQCGECGKVIKSWCNWRAHLRQHRIDLHKKQKEKELAKAKARGALYRCKKCPEVFATWQSLGAHMNAHRGNFSLSCRICHEGVYNAPSKLLIHCKESHDTEEAFSCEDCGKLFSKWKAKRDHEKCHRKGKKKEEVKKDPLEEYECSICAESFVSISAASAHMNTHKDRVAAPPCHICDKAYPTAAELETHCQEEHQTEEAYRCNHCGQLFKDGEEMYEHEQKHEEDGTMGCVRCKIKFVKRCAYDQHMQIMHKMHKQVVCEYCPRFFTYDNSKEQHIATEHKDDESQWKCSQCDTAVFAEQSELVEHVRSNHPILCYTCDECSVTVKDIHSVKKHMYVHTGKPYPCHLCDQRYSVLAQLKRHIEVNHKGKKDYVCEICGKGFGTRGNLKSHMVWHSDEKTHQCAECGMTFKDRGSLRDHSNVHTGQKPYKCKICQKGFAQGSTRNKHQATHSPKRPRPRAKPMIGKPRPRPLAPLPPGQPAPRPAALQPQQPAAATYNPQMTAAYTQYPTVNYGGYHHQIIPQHTNSAHIHSHSLSHGGQQQTVPFQLQQQNQSLQNPSNGNAMDLMSL